MRRMWEEPRIYVENFTPNEYVAACGDSGITYNFTCDAGGGVSGDVYLETNGQAGLQTSGRNQDRYLSGYHACGTTHVAESNDQFLQGYYVTETGDWWNPTRTVTEVIVWRGPDGDNTHCTTNLDMSKWETAKS